MERYKLDPMGVAKELWSLEDKGYKAKWIAENHEDSGSVAVVRKLLKLRVASPEIRSLIADYKVQFGALDREGNKRFLRLPKGELKKMTAQEFIMIAQLENVEQLQKKFVDASEQKMVAEAGGVGCAKIVQFPTKNSDNGASTEKVYDDSEKSVRIGAQSVHTRSKLTEESERTESEHVQSGREHVQDKLVNVESVDENQHQNGAGLAPKKYRQIIFDKLDSAVTRELENISKSSLMQKVMSLFIVGLTIYGAWGQPAIVLASFIAADVLFLYAWILRPTAWNQSLRFVVTCFVVIAVISQPVRSLLNAHDAKEQAHAGHKSGEDFVSPARKEEAVRSAHESVRAYKKQLNLYEQNLHPKQVFLVKTQKDAEEWVARMKQAPHKLNSPKIWRGGEPYKPYREAIEAARSDLAALKLDDKLSNAKAELARAEAMVVSTYTHEEKSERQKAWVNALTTEGVSLIVRLIFVFGIIVLAQDKRDEQLATA